MGWDDAWRSAVRECYGTHASKPALKSEVVALNACPQINHDIDWWGAWESLRKRGTAVAVHFLPSGRALLH